jgi:hypothetical protein
MRGPKKPMNWTNEKSLPVEVNSIRKMSVGLVIPLVSSWSVIPTMEAIITPTIAISAKMMRNRVLLK